MNTTKNWVMRHLPYIGTAVLLCGIFCLIAKALSPEYLDAQGYLHENFFLLPSAFALLLAASAVPWGRDSFLKSDSPDKHKTPLRMYSHTKRGSFFPYFLFLASRR